MNDKDDIEVNTESCKDCVFYGSCSACDDRSSCDLFLSKVVAKEKGYDPF